MDVISHGLWGGLAFGRRNYKTYLVAFLIGIAPDMISFGIFFAMTILGLASGPDWSNGRPSLEAIHSIVPILYDITHSLLVFLAGFALVWLLRRHPYWPLAAWGLHILMDIPTHSTRFFPTPFLWPFSSYRFDGIPWIHPWIFWPNLAVLAWLYCWWLLARRRPPATLTEKNRRFFSRVAGRYDSFFPRVLYFERLYRRAMEALKRELGERLAKPEVQVLDVACGTGEMLYRLALEFPQARYTGVDLTPAMLEQARAKFTSVSDAKSDKTGSKSGAAFIVGSADKLPLPDTSFDVAMITEAFHHLERPETALKEIHRVLKPAGAFFLVDVAANRPWQKTVLGRFFGPLEYGVDYYSLDELRQMFTAGGFKILTTETRTLNNFVLAERV